MLLETLKALIVAGKETLQDTCQLTVTAESLAQVEPGNLNFPLVAELQIRSGTLQMVHLGCDQNLCDHLNQSAAKPDLEALAQDFLNRLLKEMEGRNPRGKVVSLESGNVSLQTRGVRTYGIRLATKQGQLYLLAEVPSKVELEIAKGSEFLTGMISTYMPRDWMNREILDNKGLIDGLLILLRKIESDIYLEVPQGDETAVVGSGIILEQRTLNGTRVMKISSKLTSAPADLEPGTRMHGTVGLEDRSLDFNLVYEGHATHPLVGDVNLDCSLFSVPEQFEIVQRRKAFRIPVQGEVQVEVATIPEGTRPIDAFQSPDRNLMKGSLADLSFSGARVIFQQEGACQELEEGQRVICRMVFPDEFEPMEVLAVVRRMTLGLANRNEWQEEIGLEFLVSPDFDRRALDYIRQYVLAEQRTRLAQRIHVGGGA